MPKVSETIHSILHARRTPANTDLVARWSPEMETQANVAAGEGEPVAGKRSTWSDGINEWFNIRIPKHAASEPEWNDYDLRFPLPLHVEGIGMTGWRWTAKRSCWCGFDFDAITDHAKGVGIDDRQLEKVKQAACGLPYVEVRKSTGGGGIHLYTYFADDGIPTDNHTQHAALARSVLEMMSRDTGFDFASHIDACGQVMWVWHRKMTEENQGLTIVKPAEKHLALGDLPHDWRDQLEVVKRGSRVRSNEITEEDTDSFERLTSQRTTTPLDDSHKAQIEALMRSGFTTLWIPDRHLLQTHTKALQNLLEGPEGKELGLVGLFQTESPGNDPGTPNCFLIPLWDGAWQVYRFSPGVKEAGTWSQDGQSWTTCYFNRYPDLDAACAQFGGVEREKGGYTFGSAEDAIKAAKCLGAEFELDGIPEGRKVTLRNHGDGRLVMQIKRETGDKPLKGWDNRNGKYVRILDGTTGPAAAHGNRVKQGGGPMDIRLITSRELDSAKYEIEYLIEKTLVKGQPCMVAGPKKGMKTSILIAMAIALATGRRFLDHFSVTRTCRVLVLSGESGLAILQETARRICQSMGVELAEIGGLFWSDFLPNLDDARHLDALDRMIRKTACEVLIVDPAYLCMPGSDAGNLFVQGSLLRQVSDVCQRHGVGLVLAHHTRKLGKAKNRAEYQVPELDDMAWTGFAEFARQWLLIGRREDFVPGTGLHNLWLNIGGSAGHSALWAIDIHEGDSSGPRSWKVEVSTPHEVRTEKKAATWRERLLDAARQFPDGETKTGIFRKAGVRSSEASRNVFDALVSEGVLVQHDVRKSGAKRPGFRLSPEALTACAGLTDPFCLATCRLPETV